MSDTGGGHRSAAEALATVISNTYGDTYQVTTVDLISDYTFWPLSQIRHAYAPAVHRAEPLYRFAYWLPHARALATDVPHDHTPGTRSYGAVLAAG